MTTRQLPLLPGNTFEDYMLRGNHHKRHIFDYKNGIPIVADLSTGIPDEEPPKTTQPTTQKLISTKKFTESDKPKWLSLDRKVLRFYCYFKEGVHESNLENERVRRCVLYYYLEDDTIHVSEPHQDNSGIPQGTLIKRHRIPKGTNEWMTIQDLNVGQDVEIYGKVFRIVDCDKFTKDFYEKIGIKLGEPEDYPPDPYIKMQEVQKTEMEPIIRLTPQDLELKRYLEYSFRGRRCNPGREEQVKVLNFLKNDRKVLRFYCCWDDRESLYGDFRRFTLEYYLSDDRIKISEIYPNNSGRDPFPVFVKKQKIPKPDNSGYYTKEDLGIGKTITVFAKTMLLYDCDEFTKEYYRKNYGITNFEPIKVGEEPPKKIVIEPPPYTGFGSEEDSLVSWKYLVLKPPKKDIIKYIKNDRKCLRFSAKLISNIPEDQDRKFVITFHLADDTLSIFEPAIRNSGIVGGKFLQRQRVKKTLPDGTSRPFEPQDFFVGAEITVYGYKFILTGTDERTIKYMESRPKTFTMADINEVLKKLRNMIFLKHVRITDAFRDIDKDKGGTITLEEFRQMFRNLNLDVSEQEIITLMRFFDQDRDGEISLQEFINQILPKDYTGELDAKGLPTVDITLLDKQKEEEEKFKQAQKKREKEVMQKRIFKKFKEKIENRRLLFQDTFRIMSDRSPDSMIGEKEFRKAVNDILQMNFNEEEVNALVEMCFPPGHKRISLQDFIKIVEGTSTWFLTYS